MGFCFEIGNAILDYSENEVEICCDILGAPDGPKYEKNSFPTSKVTLPHTTTAAIIKMLDLENLIEEGFMWSGVHRKGLMQEHPGIAPITPDHIKLLEARLALYKVKHPSHRPVLLKLRDGTDKSPFTELRDFLDYPASDFALFWGEWFLFWMKLAMIQCNRPIFKSS
jgi:hypothetical protein